MPIRYRRGSPRSFLLIPVPFEGGETSIVKGGDADC
jgi:hypothetical protein